MGCCRGSTSATRSRSGPTQPRSASGASPLPGGRLRWRQTTPSTAARPRDWRRCALPTPTATLVAERGGASCAGRWPLLHDPFSEPDCAGEPLRDEDVPLTESIADCVSRVRPFWENELLPALLDGSNCLVVGHANGLRALVACVQQNVDDESLPSLGLPNGLPLIYELEPDGGVCDGHFTCPGHVLDMSETCMDRQRAVPERGALLRAAVAGLLLGRRVPRLQRPRPGPVGRTQQRRAARRLPRLVRQHRRRRRRAGCGGGARGGVRRRAAARCGHERGRVIIPRACRGWVWPFSGPPRSPPSYVRPS
mmetsp:Transcript_11102/g.32088  ORF Transcript_11102/g.32088 Transcript_11102/m.32088 type:complete len:309 (+) Transcript_11102:456-1382(+)